MKEKRQSKVRKEKILFFTIIETVLTQNCSGAIWLIRSVLEDLAFEAVPQVV